VLYIAGDNKIPIRCAIGRLKFDHGVVAFDKTLMDTQKSILHSEGTAALKTQELQSKITADTKKSDLLDLHSPVLLEGKIRSPSIHLAARYRYGVTCRFVQNCTLSPIGEVLGDDA
jgi:AsmA family protein